MTQENLEAECFGGKFKVKKKEGSNLPEERQRYWNGYILIYEARDDHKTPRTPKKSFSGTSHRRSVGPGMVRSFIAIVMMVIAVFLIINQTTNTIMTLLIIILSVVIIICLTGTTSDNAISHL